METKIVKSTYEVLIEDPEQKRLLDQEYQELLLSELLSCNHETRSAFCA